MNNTNDRYDRLHVAFMVSLSNHEGFARPWVRTALWFDDRTMKRFGIRMEA